jgi:dihydrodipicolinate synthase/N-acetylneuraminate lyase
MLSGIIPPVVTPFDENDEIDENGLRAVVRFMLEAGVHGLAVCGSTGEGHTLSPDETRRITEITAEEVNSHIARISLHAYTPARINSSHHRRHHRQLNSSSPSTCLRRP